jgi:hypothetical protein
MKKFQGHASPEATAPTVKPKTRKRARFFERERKQLSLVDIILEPKFRCLNGTDIN